jgi:hypothetical protein
MAKPITVAEDEALKFYRLKNILTPPAIVELSELDREMSDILSRSDLTSEERAFQYKKALVKFQNMFKDHFQPEVPKEKEVEKTKTEKIVSEPLPFPTPNQTEEEMELEDKKTEEEEQPEAQISLIPKA